MGIKDNAISHYRDKLAGELLSIDVPEWDGKIYYRNAINGKKQSAIMSLYAKNKMIEAMTMSLIVRALDKDGNPIWHPKELTSVMHEYDNMVVSNIVAEMTKDEPSIEEAKKY
jgi:homoaconitase/3-isopropylmalate dehydratase large subunit